MTATANSVISLTSDGGMHSGSFGSTSGPRRRSRGGHKLTEEKLLSLQDFGVQHHTSHHNRSMSDTDTLDVPSVSSTMKKGNSRHRLTSRSSTKSRDSHSLELGRGSASPKRTCSPSTVDLLIDADDDAEHSSEDDSEEDDYDDEEEAIRERDPLGRFQCFYKVLGSGAFKTVYKAMNVENATDVAWNELKSSLMTPAQRREFSEEFKLLKSLKHPNILTLEDAWGAMDDVDDGNSGCTSSRPKKIVFITELMTSGTLREYLHRNTSRNQSGKPSLKLKVIKNWCRQILKGLDYLHSREKPIIHRDLKCDNIFINGTSGEVKIGDMGLATVKSKQHAATVIGTPEFMAPEMYKEEYNEMVDIYAFGMCALEMATLEYPYSECHNAAQIYKKVIEGHRPSSLATIANTELRALIDICLSDAGNRLTAAELLQHPFFQEHEGDDVELVRPRGSSSVVVPATALAPSLIPVDGGSTTSVDNIEPEAVDSSANGDVDVVSLNHRRNSDELVVMPGDVDTYSDSVDDFTGFTSGNRSPAEPVGPLPTSSSNAEQLLDVSILKTAGDLVYFRTYVNVCDTEGEVQSQEIDEKKIITTKKKVDFSFTRNQDDPGVVVQEMVAESLLHESLKDTLDSTLTEKVALLDRVEKAGMSVTDEVGFQKALARLQGDNRPTLETTESAVAAEVDVDFDSVASTPPVEPLSDVVIDLHVEPSTQRSTSTAVSDNHDNSMHSLEPQEYVTWTPAMQEAWARLMRQQHEERLQFCERCSRQMATRHRDTTDKVVTPTTSQAPDVAGIIVSTSSTSNTSIKSKTLDSDLRVETSSVPNGNAVTAMSAVLASTTENSNMEETGGDISTSPSPVSPNRHTVVMSPAPKHSVPVPMSPKLSGTQCSLKPPANTLRSKSVHTTSVSSLNIPQSNRRTTAGCISLGNSSLKGSSGNLLASVGPGSSSTTLANDNIAALDNLMWSVFGDGVQKKSSTHGTNGSDPIAPASKTLHQMMAEQANNKQQQGQGAALQRTPLMGSHLLSNGSQNLAMKQKRPL